MFQLPVWYGTEPSATTKDDQEQEIGSDGDDGRGDEADGDRPMVAGRHRLKQKTNATSEYGTRAGISKCGFSSKAFYYGIGRLKFLLARKNKRRTVEN